MNEIERRFAEEEKAQARARRQSQNKEVQLQQKMKDISDRVKDEGFTE